MVRFWGRRGGRRKVAVLIGEASNITGKCIFHGTTVLNGTVDGEQPGRRSRLPAEGQAPAKAKRLNAAESPPWPI